MVDTDFGGWRTLPLGSVVDYLFGCRTLRFFKGADFDSAKLFCVVGKVISPMGGRHRCRIHAGRGTNNANTRACGQFHRHKSEYHITLVCSRTRSNTGPPTAVFWTFRTINKGGVDQAQVSRESLNSRRAGVTIRLCTTSQTLRPIRRCRGLRRAASRPSREQGKASTLKVVLKDGEIWTAYPTNRPRNP
jgi:hypothetical protein